jgi:hypothetical protein
MPLPPRADFCTSPPSRQRTASADTRAGKRSAVEILPRVHLVASLFNRRTSRSRGKLFERLLEQAVAVEPVPYRALIRAGEAWWDSPEQIQQLVQSTK